MKRLTVLALLTFILVRAGDGAPALRVRVGPELAEALRATLSTQEAKVVVEAGDPAAMAAADIVVGRLSLLTRALETGRLDEETMVDLGVSPEERVVAAAVADSPRIGEVRSLLTWLGSTTARQAFSRKASLVTPEEALAAQAEAFAPGTGRYAASVVDWWLPVCSLSHNAYSDPNEVLGVPNAAKGAKDEYTGMMSLGQGGWVVVDMGQTVTNGAGNDVRVYQTTSSEGVTLYAGDSPSGPFRLIAFRRWCGDHVPGAPNSWNYCDFDLAEGAVTSARYLKIEDGELFPCLRGGTVSEGADIDAVELLGP